MKDFSFWSPSSDCGGFTNDDIMKMADGWNCLTTLEVAGTDITMDGEFGLSNSRRAVRLMRPASGIHGSTECCLDIPATFMGRLRAKSIGCASDKACVVTLFEQKVGRGES